MTSGKNQYIMLGPTIFDGPSNLLSPYAVSPLHPSALLNGIDSHPLSPNTPQTPTSPGDYSDTPLTPNAEAVENDAHKIQQRLKQIGFGKSTKGVFNLPNSQCPQLPLRSTLPYCMSSYSCLSSTPPPPLPCVCLCVWSNKGS